VQNLKKLTVFLSTKAMPSYDRIVHGKDDMNADKTVKEMLDKTKSGKKYSNMSPGNLQYIEALIEMNTRDELSRSNSPFSKDYVTLANVSLQSLIKGLLERKADRGWSWLKSNPNPMDWLKSLTTNICCGEGKFLEKKNIKLLYNLKTLERDFPLIYQKYIEAAAARFLRDSNSISVTVPAEVEDSQVVQKEQQPASPPDSNTPVLEMKPISDQIGKGLFTNRYFKAGEDIK